MSFSIYLIYNEVTSENLEYWRSVDASAHGFHPFRRRVVVLAMISAALFLRSEIFSMESNMYFFRRIFPSAGSKQVKSIYQFFPVCNFGRV